MRLILYIFLFFLFCFPAFAQETSSLEKIVVRVGSADSVEISSIQKQNADTPSDLFNRFAGLDLRTRSAFGVQGDLSLRGSTYEQVGVSIDGINLMDPQTGHHNLDLPLTVFDLERVELNKEGASSIYGAGALAGAVNLVTKKPRKKGLNLDTIFGENALFAQVLSLSLPQENLSTRISFDHKKAKAARPNTDFEYQTASFYLDYDALNAAFDTLFGYQKKDFGADSFYSNLFPEEEEHTETIFVRNGLKYPLDPASIKGNIFFRKHHDKFILKRNNPTAINYHTTFIYGFNLGLDLPSRYADLSLGADLGNDQINSSNLGKHSRLHQAGYAGFSALAESKLSADFRFRLDNYQKWSLQESFNLGLKYKINGEHLWLAASMARGFRLPSFTELYYSDSANKGNPDLKVETAETVTCGLNFKQEKVEANLDCFLRRGYNLIDWTRTSTQDRWTATNLGRVDFRGLEFSTRLKPGLSFHSLDIKSLTFSYSYTSADKRAGGFFSKYALDILKHQYIFEIASGFLGLDCNWELSYKQRYYADSYFLGNLYIGKKFPFRSLSLEPFVRIDNFTNVNYSEIAGVVQPGRWIQSGVKFEW